MTPHESKLEPVTAIKPNTFNPNQEDPASFYLLCLSIAEQGMVQNIHVRKETDEITAGEHRWTAVIVVEALKRDGKQITESTCASYRAKRDELLKTAKAMIPVVRTSMTDDEFMRQVIRDNRTKGEERTDKIAKIMRELKAKGAEDETKSALNLTDDQFKRFTVANAAAAYATEGYGQAQDVKPATKGKARHLASVGGMDVNRSESAEARDSGRQATVYLVMSADEKELFDAVRGDQTPIDWVMGVVRERMELAEANK